MEVQAGCKSKSAGKPILNRHISRRERKFALLEDVDKLKKKLKQEENVHRALERAFSRRLGTLPHLPPYLPPQTLELLAEIAVLEEEVVRLEEEVVSFQQGLNQEAVYLSSQINLNSDNNSLDQSLKTTISKHDGSQSVSLASPADIKSEPSKLPQQKPLISLSQSVSSKLSYSHGIESDFLIRLVDKKADDLKKHELCVGDDGALGKENRSSSNSNTKIKSSPEMIVDEVQNLVKRPLIKFETEEKCVPPKFQNSLVDQDRAQESCSSSSSGDKVMEAERECNKISEKVLKCLIDIFLRLTKSKSKSKTMDAEAFSNLLSVDLTNGDRGPSFRDPYGICLKSKKRDIGPYKDLYAIESGSIDFKKKSNASLLIRRLKLLLEKLASTNLEDLTHQQKLAFWLNTYNICMMKAYLDYGIPASPEMMTSLMQKATITSGGHTLNAITIEHSILRRPNNLLKSSCIKTPEKYEIEIREKFGLEWSEPLVTFALCNGTWSSPSVRVYTPSKVENELTTAKRDYLQAAFSITKTNRLLIPKMLDWNMLDFAKDFKGLMDWVCLQLPGELRKQTVMCLDKREKEPFSKRVQIMAYDYRFRYLIQR